MTKVSIAIPTWESYGRGQEFLEDLLRTIEIQTLNDYDVVVSDHSKDNEIKVLVNYYSDKGMNIRHIRNDVKRGNSPANTNTAIDACTGEVVKIMFQDDFFYDDEALEKIYNSLVESDHDWIVCGSNHTNDEGNTFYGNFMPEWNENILNGVNTISSPSVMAFKRCKITERFDESLSMVMDCEMYYRMNQIYGQPVYLKDDLVTNRIHNQQLSSLYVNGSNYDKKFNQELEYCKSKYAASLV